MKSENRQNGDNVTPQNAAIIEVPNVPISVFLEQWNDGIYVTLFSKNGPCPCPPGKMKSDDWEGAKRSAHEMLAGLNQIMSTPRAKNALASIAKLFGK